MKQDEIDVILGQTLTSLTKQLPKFAVILIVQQLIDDEIFDVTLVHNASSDAPVKAVLAHLGDPNAEMRVFEISGDGHRLDS